MLPANFIFLKTAKTHAHFFPDKSAQVPKHCFWNEKVAGRATLVLTRSEVSFHLVPNTHEREKCLFGTPSVETF